MYSACPKMTDVIWSRVEGPANQHVAARVLSMLDSWASTALRFLASVCEFARHAGAQLARELLQQLLSADCMSHENSEPKPLFGSSLCTESASSEDEDADLASVESDEEESDGDKASASCDARRVRCSGSWWLGPFKTWHMSGMLLPPVLGW